MKVKLPGVLPFALLFALGCSADGGDGSLMGFGGNTTSVTGGASTASGGGGSATVGVGGGNGGSASGVATFGGMAQAAGSPSGGVMSGTAGSTTGAGGVVGQAGMTGQAGTGGGGPVPTDGKGLFDLNCKLCHGEQGIGSPLAPETQHPVRDYDLWVVRNGRAQTTFPKPMEKWGTDKLTDAQLMLIFDYLDQPPQPTTGQALYLDYCGNCHGKDASGGPTMRPLKNEVSKVLTQARSGKSVGQYQMRHDSMPKFTTMRITDAELKLIQAAIPML